jgi:hypothetical protein
MILSENKILTVEDNKKPQYGAFVVFLASIFT